jgi:hypothetical protein
MGVPDTAPQTQSARAASRRAQFQLWIFSYTILVGSSKRCVSRVMIIALARKLVIALWRYVEIIRFK